MAEPVTELVTDKILQDATATAVMTDHDSLVLDQHGSTGEFHTNSGQQQPPQASVSSNTIKLNAHTISLPYILKSDDDFAGSCLNLVYKQAPPNRQRCVLGTTSSTPNNALATPKAISTNPSPLSLQLGSTTESSNLPTSSLRQPIMTPPSSPEDDNEMFSPPPSAKSLTAEFNTFDNPITHRRASVKRTQNATVQNSKPRILATCTTDSAGSAKNQQLSFQEQELPPLPRHEQQTVSSVTGHPQHQRQHQRLPPLPEDHHQLPPLPKQDDAPVARRANSSANSHGSSSSSSSFTTVGTSGTMALNAPTKGFDDGVDLGNRKHQQPLPSPPLQITTHKAKTSDFKCDNNYHPDSSLFAASVTSPAPNPLSLAPHHPNFPPATLDSLNNFRREAQASPHDLALQLNFAKYLMEAVQQVQINDAARSSKAKTAMLSEAQRIVKTLAMKSRIGRSGYAEALFYLANAYGAGLMLLSVNHEKAFHLYLQGSKQCHPECTYRAGVCYELGLGTRRDNARAIRFYRKASNLGDPSAMYKLAMILLHGLLGQAKHPKEAISWLKRAAPLADAYHPEILHELGLVYENDSIPSVIPDQDYTRELVTKAARFGYAPSQYKLGLAYENGLWNCPIDARRSIAWYGKASEQGHMESALALSGWYLTGAMGSNGTDTLLPSNDVEAYLWARKAADSGYAKGQYACGYYSESGIGTEQNLMEAMHWYELAAQQHYAKAIDRLAEMKTSTLNTKRQRKKQQQRLSLQTSRSYLAKSDDSLRRNSALASSRRVPNHQHPGTCPPNTPQVIEPLSSSKPGPTTETAANCQIM